MLVKNRFFFIQEDAFERVVCEMANGSLCIEIRTWVNIYILKFNVDVLTSPCAEFNAGLTEKSLHWYKIILQ